MHRLGSLRSLHRLSSTTPDRYVGPWPRQKSPPMRRKYPQFVAQPLLLDLIAEDVPSVRNYDPDVDGVPEHDGAKEYRRQAALEQRIAAFEAEHAEDEATFQHSIASSHSWRINDCDVLAAALAGLSTAPSNKPAPPPGFTDSLLAKNGIPRYARHATFKAIPYMLRRKKQASKLVSSLDPAGQLEQHREQIRSCLHFDRLKRTVQHMLHRPGGGPLTADLSNDIGDALARIAVRPEPPHPFDVLAFSNNVFLNLSSRGLPVGERFKDFALPLAVQCSALSVARMYLAPEPEAHGPGLSLINRLANALEAISESFDTASAGRNDPATLADIQRRRVEVFGFLTGTDISGQVSPFSLRHMVQDIKCTSTADLVVMDSGRTALKHFIHILGELGALRTLWYTNQWLSAPTAARSSDNTQTDGNTSSNTSSKPGEDKADSGSLVGSEEFVHALVRTLNAILSHRISLTAFDQGSATGILEEDLLLDLRAIGLSTKSHSVSHLGASHSRDNTPMADYLAREDSSFRRGVLDAFSKPTIEGFMEAVWTVLKQEATWQKRHRTN
ncbi:uncharacterized protein JN550_013132 [Neoarthrinium moseri]|uniref:uncharacterized protein n=1 Tax=Neoarthrinium moseri TaxID=1658444 RepID=UPI001FDDC0E9|nr:uncharacterized protein JN550_013132 [Neoarthrinium moseri]KAI1857620.1 hypothetical protein JN550_013132 [Neoarthrinium moseri]